MKKIRSESSVGSEIEIRDFKMILAIISRGHQFTNVKMVDGTMYFSFDRKKVSETISEYISGDPFSVDIHAVWRAWDLFKMYLNNLKGKS